MRRIIAIVGALLIVGASIFSLVFWTRLPGRLPSDVDYQRADAFIREHSQEGDVIVLAPSWAERGRQFLKAAPVYAGYDLAHDEYRGTKRQWLVALPDVPRFSLDEARQSLLARGASLAPGERIGQLWVEPFAVAGPPVAYSFTDSISKATASIEWVKDESCRRLPSGALQCPRGDWNRLQPGWFEVNERPVYCLWAHPVDNGSIRVTFDDVPSGHIRGWAAFVGQAAEGDGASVELEVDADGRFAQAFSIANAFGQQPFELQLPANDGSHRVDFVVTASNSGRRHFCFDAWVESASAIASPKP